ncbi:hypothetical protein [Raoultibacter phocaeensis]|uniref:hypothetical protein n=1 Tax=Raoultibacter phocaeensis TaxID=2479841 RepID=UPI00111A83CD|nr:hypothetical protein [Raoultibacter phocaeensis]
MNDANALPFAEPLSDKGGLFMEYPTVEEVARYVRDLPFEQRLTILSQGFHRGPAEVHCYNLKEFVMALAKREFDNPAGGVRVLDFDKVVLWLNDTIGDTALADAVRSIADDAPNMAEATDRTRLTVFVRVEQYNEVLEALSDEERAELGGWHA